MAGFHLDHHLLTVAFGVLGNLISVCVYLAPLPTFRRIYKEKSTMGFQALPYVIALFSSMLWLYYAFMKRNSLLLVSINSFGCVIETLYIAFFLYYASTKIRRHTLKLIGVVNVALYGVIFIVSFLALKDHRLRVQVVGWICVTISVSVFAAPMSILFQVVRTKSVEFMPFSLSFFLTLSAVMWLAYGLLQKDMCVALPNVLGFVLGLVQMLMYVIYRKSKLPVTVHEPKLPEQHVINIMVLGTPEVHPLHSKNFQNHQDSSQVPAVENNKEEEEEKETDHALTLEMEPCRQVKMQLDSPALVVCAA